MSKILCLNERGNEVVIPNAIVSIEIDVEGVVYLLAYYYQFGYWYRCKNMEEALEYIKQYEETGCVNIRGLGKKIDRSNIRLAIDEGTDKESAKPSVISIVALCISIFALIYSLHVWSQWR